MLLVKKYKFRKLIAVELLAFSCSLAYSDWMMYDVSSDTPSSIQGDEAVCYIKGTTNLYFNTVDGAIRYAYNNSSADNIYLIVDHKDSSGNLIPAYLKTDCTLASNDTLTLPYDSSENYAYRNPNATDSMKLNNFSDSTTARVSTYRKSLMYIESNVTFTINGRINVGGQIGNRNTGFAGLTSGNYSEIITKSGSKMNFRSSSVLDCYGYIKEDYTDSNYRKTSYVKPIITFENGSTCWQPIVFYDYSGGSNTSNDLNNNIFPLSVFDFPNIQPLLRLNKGSQMWNYVSVYIASCDEDSSASSSGAAALVPNYNKGIFLADVLLIDGVGTSGVINLDSSGYVTLDYNEASVGLTTNSISTKTYINIYGGADINDISVDVTEKVTNSSVSAGIKLLGLDTISSSNKKFPFSYRLNLETHSGTYDVNVQAKLLPGFTLKINSGSTVNLNWSTVVYSSYTYLPRYYPSSGLSVAKLVNEGTLNISNTFGGRISVPETFTDESKAAYINFSSSADNSASSVEYNGTNSLRATISYISPFNEINNDFQPTIDSFVLTSYNNNYYYKYVNSDCNFSITNTNSATFNIDINGTTYSQSSFIDGENYTYLRGSEITFKPDDNVSYFIYNEKTYDPDDYSPEGFSFELNSNTSLEVHKKISVNSISLTKTSGDRTADPNIGFTFYTTKTTSTIKGEEITISSDTTQDISSYNITTGDWIYMTDKNYKGDTSISGSPSVNGSSYSLGIRHLITDTMVPSNALNVSAAGSSCIKEGTKILDSHFNYVNVEDIKPGDDLLVFNHYTGKLESGKVLFNDFDDMAEYKVIYLYFENNIVIPIITEHGFFDIELNKYVLLDEENVFNYINHKFLYLEGNTFKEYRLLDVKIEREFTRVYSPVTKKYLNYFTEGYLSMPGATGGLINIFELDSNHVIDKKLMQKDIETYGTFGYEDFKPYVSEEFYNAFNGQYLKVSLGKGLLTAERIKELIKRYSMFD